MKAIIQIVKDCQITVEDDIVADMQNGLLIYLGIKHSDTSEDSRYLAEKIVNMRIFHDEMGKMNNSVIDLHKELCVVSQFTVYGDTSKGRRPSFNEAALAEQAETLYLNFIECIKKYKLSVCTGSFGSHMEVAYVNLGPVTFIVESKK